MKPRLTPTGVGLLIVAAIAVRLVVSGESSLYVTGDMHTLLVISIPILVLTAVATMISGTDDGHEHAGHRHNPRLTLVSLAIPVVIASAGVGPIIDYADDTPVEEDPGYEIPAQWSDPNAEPDDDPDAPSTRNTPVGPPPGGQWPEVSDGAEVDVYSISARMDQDAVETIVGKEVTTIGYVSHDPDRPGGPEMVVRTKIWCCAADGLPFAVSLVDADDLPDPGTWVSVTGTVLPPASNGDAAMSVESVTEVDQPRQVYLE